MFSQVTPARVYSEYVTSRQASAAHDNSGYQQVIQGTVGDFQKNINHPGKGNITSNYTVIHNTCCSINELYSICILWSFIFVNQQEYY